MFISQAFAQTASVSPEASTFGSFIPLILIVVVFYFLLFRPQQKRAKQEQEMISALRRGDRIITKSGFIGTVAKIINEREMLVDLGENLRVRMLRSAVGEVLNAASPVGKDSVKDKKGDKGDKGDKGETENETENEAEASSEGDAAEKAESEKKPSGLLGKLLSKK